MKIGAVSICNHDIAAIQSERVYVGYEYECCQGHRYIASSNEKPVKLSASGYVKVHPQYYLS